MQSYPRKSSKASDRRSIENAIGSPKLVALFNDAADHLRTRIAAIYGILFAFNISAWVWASIAFRHYPVLLKRAGYIRQACLGWMTLNRPEVLTKSRELAKRYLGRW
jgi:hypothetical protein